MKDTPQDDQIRSPPILLGDTFGCFNEARELRRRIVGRDPPGAVAQEVLPVLEAHAGRAQTAAEGVLQVVHPHQRQARAFARPLPRRVEEGRSGLAIVREHVRGMLAALCLDHGPGNAVENDQPLVAVLDPRAGSDKDAGPKLGNLDFPFPAQSADIGRAAPRVDGEQRHFRQVARQLAEQARLLVPAQRIRLPPYRIRYQLDLGQGLQPGQALVIHPLSGRDVQDAPDNLQTVVDRARHNAVLAPASSKERDGRTP